MRIAMVVRYFPRLTQTYVLNQITGLLDRGHEVDIFALDNYFADKPDVHPDIAKYGLMERAYIVPKRKSLRYLIFAVKSFFSLLLKGAEGRRVLFQALNVFRFGWMAYSLRLLNCSAITFSKGPYDVVHCQFGNMGKWVEILRRIGLLKGKLMVSFRGHDITQFPRVRGQDVYDKLFRQADLLLPNCDYFKRLLIRLGADENKMRILRSGIDLQLFTNRSGRRSPDGRVRVLSVGRLDEKKGFDYCIYAVAKVKQIRPHIDYSIIGEGKLKELYREIIRQERAESYVHLLGAKSLDKTIASLYDYDIFLAPSVTASRGDQDGPTNVLKEAMAAGLPVISTYHGGIPELVDDGTSGFLIPERDTDAIVGKLIYLVDHPELWNAMGDAGLEKVRRDYDSNKLNDDLVQIYTEALNLSAGAVV